MVAEATPPAAEKASRRFLMARVARRFVANNWRVVLYVVLILLCVLFAPEEPLKFIYTEF